MIPGLKLPENPEKHPVPLDDNFKEAIINLCIDTPGLIKEQAAHRERGSSPG